MKNSKHLKIVSVFIFGILLLLVSCFPTDEDASYNPELISYPDFTINGFSPISAYSGQTVTITGNNFGEYQEAAKIYFNGILAEDIISYSNTEIVVAVPAEANSGKIQVDVWTYSHETEQEFDLIPGAEISLYSPSQAAAGETITIVGDNFGTDPDAIEVLFSPEVSVDIISITNTEITVEVPFAGVSGPITLKKGPQILEGPEFLYPTGRIKFLFDNDGNNENWVSFNNPSTTSFEVSGGALNATFEPEDGYFGIEQDRGDVQFTISSAFPYLAIKLDHAPERMAFYFAGGWYNNDKNGFSNVPHTELNNKGVYIYDMSPNGPGFGSGAVQPLDGTDVYSDTNRAILLLRDFDDTSNSIDWIISFASIEDIVDFVND